jgi:hypothetical protein
MLVRHFRKQATGKPPFKISAVCFVPVTVNGKMVVAAAGANDIYLLECAPGFGRCNQLSPWRAGIITL